MFSWRIPMLQWLDAHLPADGNRRIMVDNERTALSLTMHRSSTRIASVADAKARKRASEQARVNQNDQEQRQNRPSESLAKGQNRSAAKSTT